MVLAVCSRIGGQDPGNREALNSSRLHQMLPPSCFFLHGIFVSIASFLFQSHRFSLCFKITQKVDVGTPVNYSALWRHKKPSERIEDKITQNQEKMHTNTV